MHTQSEFAPLGPALRQEFHAGQAACRRTHNLIHPACPDPSGRRACRSSPSPIGNLVLAPTSSPAWRPAAGPELEFSLTPTHTDRQTETWTQTPLAHTRTHAHRLMWDSAT